MIRWEPIGAMKATVALESSNFQSHEHSPIGETVNLISFPISDRLRRRGIAAFSTPC
jgi:hypothetical protein